MVQQAGWSISSGPQIVGEDTGSVTFLITRPDASTAQTVYVSTTVNHGSLNSNDYAWWVNEPLTFGIGVSSLPVTVQISADGTAEVPETFGLVVQSSPDQPASQYLASSTFTITDDDEPAAGGTFGPGDDWVWIAPQLGSQWFDGGAGTDRATVDFSAFSSDVLAGLVQGSYSVRSQQTSVGAWERGVRSTPTT